MNSLVKLLLGDFTSKILIPRFVSDTLSSTLLGFNSRETFNVDATNLLMLILLGLKLLAFSVGPTVVPAVSLSFTRTTLGVRFTFAFVVKLAFPLPFVLMFGSRRSWH